MKNKILIICLFFSFPFYLHAFGTYSNSLKFTNHIDSSCGIVIKNRGSIAFKKEEPKTIGEFTIISNISNKKDIYIKIKDVKKSVNILDIRNSKIYIILNRTQKIKLDTFISKGVKLNNKNNRIYIFIDKKRSNISSGNTSLTFQFEVICEN